MPEIIVEALIEDGLATMGDFTAQLIRGEWPVCCPCGRQPAVKQGTANIRQGMARRE